MDKNRGPYGPMMGVTMTFLNPELYATLKTRFGQVKVEKAGQRMVRGTGQHAGQSQIVEPGETYRICCPWCGDSKFKLHVNHAFGMTDPDTGQACYLNICYRCGPKTDQLKELTTWTSMRRQTLPAVTQEEVGDTPPYFSPGTCVRLDDPRAEPGRQYLANRGIDPDFASNTYGVSFCLEGNPEVANGAMTGRLIFPVMRDGIHVGWQARLAFEPHVFDRDKNMKGLRWYGMPGSGWRSTNLFGYDQAKTHDYCILVEGPTDMVKQGPPCIGSLGQTVSYAQAELIASTWGSKQAVIIVGDARKEGGAEETSQQRTAKMLRKACQCPVYVPLLPEGDPGSWGRAEFTQFIADHVRRAPR